MTVTPNVLWAQNKDVLFLTVSVEDCKNPTIDIKDTTLHFKGKGGSKDFEVLLTFNKDIDPSQSKKKITDREIVLQLTKTQESKGFWPRLLKESKKPHYLRTDFARWKDEDDTDDEQQTDDFNLDAMMSQMGGLQGGDASFDPKDDDEDDSDDEDLPELQQ